jgi:hypothetical protein
MGNQKSENEDRDDTRMQKAPAPSSQRERADRENSGVAASGFDR